MNDGRAMQPGPTLGKQSDQPLEAGHVRSRCAGLLIEKLCAMGDAVLSPTDRRFDTDRLGDVANDAHAALLASLHQAFERLSGQVGVRLCEVESQVGQLSARAS